MKSIRKAAIIGGVRIPFVKSFKEYSRVSNQEMLTTLTPDKLTQAGGYRYIKARRPDLYRDIIGQAHQSE